MELGSLVPTGLCSDPKSRRLIVFVDGTIQYGVQHAVFVRPGVVEWREAADPVISGRGQALVRPIVVGRCDLDVAFARGVLPMASGEPIGHEIIGQIVDVGDLVTTFKPGDRVFVPAQINCGACVACLSGRTGRCRSVPFAASYGMGREGGFGGGLADLVLVPFADAMLTPLPAGVDPCRVIGLADMALDAWRGVGPAMARMIDARVLVVGGMPPVIGLYAVGLAAALGAAELAYVDDDKARQAVAGRYGAAVLDADAVDPGKYDIVFLANPTIAAFDLALRSVAPGGSVTSAAPVVDGQPKLETAELYHRGVQWTIGRPDCRAAHEPVLEIWGKGEFDPGHVPTTFVEWVDAPAAWVSDALYVAAVCDPHIRSW